MSFRVTGRGRVGADGLVSSLFTTSSVIIHCYYLPNAMHKCCIYCQMVSVHLSGTHVGSGVL